jgi:hypothetical protein
LPQTVTRRLIMQKARGHTFPAPILTTSQERLMIYEFRITRWSFILYKVSKIGAGHSASTVCRYMVSGTFNSPKRGTFHRSLALLFTIGCRVVLSLGGWTPRLRTEFHELRATLGHRRRLQVFAYRTITFYSRPFQTVLLTIHLLMPMPTTPRTYFEQSIVTSDSSPCCLAVAGTATSNCAK